MNLSEVAGRVIDLARKVEQYYEAELPKWHRDYPLVRPGEGEPPSPPEETELRDYLASLPEELRCQLILIADLGRGLFDFDDLAGYYQELKGWFSDPERAVPELVGNASLADNLSDGLEELGRHSIDVERMPLQEV